MLKSPAQSLHLKYPISSTWEFTLNDSEVIKGEIYCTDPVAAIVVVKDQLGDVSLISVASIQESKQVNEASSDQVKMAAENMTHTKKVLEEREKRAIRLAQESLKRLNPKASPKGQIVFDRLYKACNEVVWKGESIIVLGQIQVDPPYSRETCKLLPGSTQSGGSLDRVQKIVAAASVAS